MKRMKRMIWIAVLLAVCTSCVLSKGSMSAEFEETVQLYCTDAEIDRLIPYNVSIRAKNAQGAAQQVIDLLVFGMDYEKIRHTIPQIKDGVTVKVVEDVAYVNFSDELVKAHSSDIDSEYLTVYSIVNSLASLDDVTAVRFTINGESVRDFKGHLDMRETFLPDYMV